MVKFKNKSLALLCAVIMAVVCFGGLIGCGGKEPISNEKTRLVLATQELDGVFNPFYSSSATDSNIVGMTQIGMLNSNSEGELVYGEDEACAVLDYSQEVAPDNSKTTYKFVLKNNLKFSNGSPLTMKDVLFNLYVYLDPMYYGSSTIYSTDIIGLKEYRTQQRTTDAMDNFEEIYRGQGIIRLEDLIYAVDDIYENNKDSSGNKVSMTEAQMREALIARWEYENPNAKPDDSQKDPFKSYKYVRDYNQALKQLKTVMEQTWNASVGTAQDIKFLDDKGKEHKLKTDAEAFMYNWGLLVWNSKGDAGYEGDGEFVNNFRDDAANWNKNKMLDTVYENQVQYEMVSVLSMYIYEEMVADLTAFEKQDYFDSMGEDKIRSIRGITFANLGNSVDVNGKTYNALSLSESYNPDGSIKNVDSDYEVLQIEINEIDPKAIWNFGFSVSPMYYYSDKEHIEKFDYVNNFGVEYGSRDFMDTVINSPDKIGVPYGAGPYKATTRTGNSAAVTAATFKSDNVVYFERNDHFMFPVTIKYVNYQVVAANQMLTSLVNGDIHYAEPGAEQRYIDQLENNKDKGLSYTRALTNGYGYIGINAAKIPDINVRRAIMHAINTQVAVDYYKGLAKSINRSMSTANWAYPEKSNDPQDTDDPYYVTDSKQYYEYDGTGKQSLSLIEEDWVETRTKNSAGYYIRRNKKTGELLKYTFTIAGDTSDHPAFNAMFGAAEVLNKIGFDVEVKTDLNALQKLANGNLTVWAAAWSSTIDPDMYQVYHKDSTAGAVKNWGYNAILSRPSQYTEEPDLLDDISLLIDQGRETLEVYNKDGQRGRKSIYAEALKLVMDLAVELPLYQRNDLFAFNSDIIDKSTLITTPAQGLSPFNSPTSKLWLVSFNED